MFVYNIRKEKYAHSLEASGVANRWNKNNEYVIYAGSSIALSALELVAHRNAIQLTDDYKLLHIELAVREEDIQEVSMGNLPENWKSIRSYPILQEIGSKWYQEQKAILLKVPSVLIPQESNYLINCRHPEFQNKVRLVKSEEFSWDSRLL